MRTRILIFTILLTAVQAVFAGRPDSLRSADVISTQVITHCEVPVEFSDRHQYVALEVTRELAQPESIQLTLVRQSDNNYDVLVGGDSVKAKGSLDKLPSGENPVHLVFNNGSGMEHFLFMLNPDGSGELMWSSATVSALTTCTAGLD